MNTQPTCPYCGNTVTRDGGLFHCDTPNDVYGVEGCGAIDPEDVEWVDIPK